MDEHTGSRILEGPISIGTCGKIRGSHSFWDAEVPGSLNGIIESKKSAEWRNAINDKNREWTDGPNQQESQTHPGYDLVHIHSMRKTRTRLFFFALTVIGQLSIPWSKLAANQNARKER
jgi:hypothetical protein